MLDFLVSKWKEEKDKLKARRVTKADGIDSSRTSQNSIHSIDDKVSFSITSRIPKQIKGNVSISPKMKKYQPSQNEEDQQQDNETFSDAKENLNSQYSEGSERGASNKLNGDKFDPFGVISVRLDQPQKAKEIRKMVWEPVGRGDDLPHT